jgi:hypothetical protein
MSPRIPPGVDRPQTPLQSDPARARLEHTRSALRQALASTRNSDGGWAYSSGRRSRIEPTCWASLALGHLEGRTPDVTPLRHWKRQDGWLVDVAGAPANNAFNALAALTLLQDASAAALANAVIARLIDAKGIRLDNDRSVVAQDNTLQAWSWIDGTTSWVEPTAWCLLLLKKVHAQSPTRGAAERIKVGDQMLFDRVCRDGGWNYGNSAVLGQDLWAYVPTTALALLALQDRRDHPAVQRSLLQLQKDVAQERSAVAVALAIVCLRVYGIATGSLEETAVALVTTHKNWNENVLGTAMTLYALTSAQRLGAFTL